MQPLVLIQVTHLRTLITQIIRVPKAVRIVHITGFQTGYPYRSLAVCLTVLNRLVSVTSLSYLTDRLCAVAWVTYLCLQTFLCNK